jgi:hypothetical protein
MKKFGIAVKTFLRVKQVKETILNIIKNTPNLNNYEFVVSADDEETKKVVQKEFPWITVIGGDRLGSGGNTNRIFDYLKTRTEVFCIFDDDCFPNEIGWEKVMLDVLTPDSQINYKTHAYNKQNPCYLNPCYLGSATHFSELFTEPLETVNVNGYDLKYWHWDCNVFTAIKSEIVEKSGGINVKKYTKNYGFWHTEFGNRLQMLQLTPYRTISIDKLDLMLHALDYSGLEIEQGISTHEKFVSLREYQEAGIGHDVT